MLYCREAYLEFGYCRNDYVVWWACKAVDALNKNSRKLSGWQKDPIEVGGHLKNVCCWVSAI